ncbi:general substrate transporter [Aspergillus multicolor]|uniref:general substrate transporter n=1 Tax=Aspergillus multicolor TaxID=41759 RepID=UPI003CCC9B2F
MAGLIGTEGTPFTITYKNLNGCNFGSDAIYEIGCFFGAVFIFVFGERLGRRFCLGGVAVMLVGAALQAASGNMGQLIAGRIVTGLGNGANFSTIPVAAFNGWLVVWGVVIAYLVDYGCANYQNDIQFRFPMMVFGIVMMALITIFLESPQWLVSQGRNEEAKEVLRWITPRQSEQEDSANEVYTSTVQMREI